MADRKTLLANLSVGDIFHAECPSGATCICLVLALDAAAIQARRVTTQESLKFDRQTGIEKRPEGQELAVISSVTALPAEINDVLLKLDQKYGALMGMDEKSRFADPERLRLTDAEKRALLFVESHYSSNRLPDSA
jgi:hypothetical protein